MGFEYSLAARGLSESGTLGYDTWNDLRTAAADLLDPGDQCTVYKITETSGAGVGSPLYNGSVGELPAGHPRTGIVRPADPQATTRPSPTQSSMDSTGIQIPNDSAKNGSWSRWRREPDIGASRSLVATTPGRAVLLARMIPNQASGDRSRPATGSAIRSAIDSRRCFFAGLASTGTMTLVVEGSPATRGPHVQEQAAFAEDRVLHWAVVADGDQNEAVKRLRSGASGYPLNAFLCERPPPAFGLDAGAELDADALDELGEAVKLVIVAAYDAETYLCWTPEVAEPVFG